MARRALVPAIAVTLALSLAAVAGCRADKSGARKESTEKAPSPTAAPSMQPVTPTMPTAPAPNADALALALDEGEGERGPIDKRMGEIPTGMASASASSTSTLQANHNPKGSEPERVGLCPPGVPLCGLEHNPKGTEPERRPALPPPEINTR
jgi:hypothetical protein